MNAATSVNSTAPSARLQDFTRDLLGLHERHGNRAVGTHDHTWLTTGRLDHTQLVLLFESSCGPKRNINAKHVASIWDDFC